ncbi:MAG: hypothetical protein ACPLXM_00345 [Bacteroidales bacterium]
MKKRLPALSLVQGSLVLLILLLVSTYQLKSQTLAERKELFSNGMFFFESEDYKEAVYYFLKLHDYNPKNGNINYHIGMCYLNMPGEEYKAIPYFEQALEKATIQYKKSTFEESKAPFHTYFYLAQAYRINNQLDKALEMLDKFTYSRYFEGNYNVGVVNAEIEACKRAKVIQDKPIEIELTNLGEPINTPSNNYDPVLTPDESVIIYMTSLKFYNAIFMSRKVDGKWTEPENITPQVGSDGESYPTCISANGRELYLVKKIKNSSHIYVSQWENDKWSIMQPLNSNINSSKSEIYACFSPDGKYLYFSSNRRGGLGGFDIWRSEKINGDWGKAENLGPNINTKSDEIAPFLSATGRVLFFASQGHQNMGGFDVFYSKLDDQNKWSPAINIGFPINTTGDNKFYFPVGNGTSGYITRKKDDSDMMDIFRVIILSGDQLKDLQNQ